MTEPARSGTHAGHRRHRFHREPPGSRAWSPTASRVRVIARSADRARELLPDGGRDRRGRHRRSRSGRAGRAGRDDGVSPRGGVSRGQAPRLALSRSQRGRLPAAARRRSRGRRCGATSTAAPWACTGTSPRRRPTSSTAYEPGDVYQATKCEAEQLALSYRDRIPLAVARPTAIYGPGDTRLLKMFRMVARQRFPLVGGGENYYHTVHVNDLVRGLRLLGTHPRAVGEIFILGGERYLKLSELAGHDRGGGAGCRLPGSACRPGRSSWSARWSKSSACPSASSRRSTAAGWTSTPRAGPSASRRPSVCSATGPRCKLKDGIRETFDWYVANGYIEAAYQR